VQSGGYYGKKEMASLEINPSSLQKKKKKLIQHRYKEKVTSAI
jgi:hypothetical protein